MIDLHCHYLPGIDDGAGTMEEALDLARASVANGIHCAIMTPHLHPGRHDNTKAGIARHTTNFRRALKQAGIPLHIGFAAEVRLGAETLSLVESDQVPFLGELDGYKIMLLEFPHSHMPPGADNLVQRLLDHKIRPIIAHPERNKDVMRNVDKITPFIEMGCILQLTAASVANRFGDKAYQRAIQLLQCGAPIVLATDAHNLNGRAPMLREGLEAATAIVGHKAADDMVNRLPLSIVRSQFKKQPAAAPQPIAPPTAAPKPAPTPNPAATANPAASAPPPYRPSAPAGNENAAPQADFEQSFHAISDNELQYRIQRQIDAALPGAIEKFLQDKLLLDLEKELLPSMRRSFGDGLQLDLARRLQQALTMDVRSSIIAGIIQDARNEAYQEFRNRFKHTLQKSLVEELIGLLKLVDNYEDTSGLIAHLQQVTYETH
ncbi:tyrosine-protein phosphatase [Pseudomaricurvus alcaniphilus]|uniref:tyrosine-protein phosphatase n=1 Tax=Pseudomaricurvus alcaniphilus TaxID=1166482 RepID=UPI001A9E6570|nr:CpsB/CapC family capsule biosynthesis tyrosine phosphatase [Pseudomaricurvus alcaniphilus]